MKKAPVFFQIRRVGERVKMQRKFVKKTPDFMFWVLAFAIYIVPNLLMFWLTLENEIVIVDLRVVQLNLSFWPVLGCLTAVMFSFFLIVYTCKVGSRFFLTTPTWRLTKSVGLIVFLVQFASVIAVLVFDFGRVGGLATSSSIVAVLISYLHPDEIFLAYYGHSRNKGIPYFNLALYVFSNVIRGWSGIWLILFFIEFYYLVQRSSGKKLIVQVCVAGFAMLAFYPFASAIKEKVRTADEAVADVTFVDSMSSLFSRLQHVTSVILIAQEAESISQGLKSGQVIPYYLDNQIAQKIVVPSATAVSLQRYLSIRYLVNKKDVPSDAYVEDFGWYVHTGVAGWFFVLNFLSLPFYILFVIGLTIFPFWVAGRFIGARSLMPVLYVAGLVYVFHGWYVTQINFCIGLSIYALLLNFFGRRDRRGLTDGRGVSEGATGSVQYLR
jgi:hypothetical protein